MRKAEEGAAPRNRRIPPEKADKIVRLYRSGRSREQIAAEAGCSVSTVRNCLMAAGLARGRKKGTGCFELPETFIMAEHAEPKRFKCVISGKRWEDVTEEYLHTVY